MKEKIHLIGIGGIGLSGLAQILHEQGHEVSGSDLEDSAILSTMRDKEIKIFIGHKEEYLPKDASRVIYSSAIPLENVELKRALNLGIETMTYAQAIKEFTENLYTIAICGTHGKTTVTAFSALAMLAGGKDPNVIIGSNIQEFNNNNYRTGKDDYFIVEACEYKRNFLNYSPNIIILTNLEAEHLDYYKDLEDYKDAFKEFIAKLPEDGYLITNIDDNNVLDVIKDFDGNLITFSTKDEDADWYLNNNDVLKSGKKVAELELSIPGVFNRQNALCGLILGQLLNLDRSDILERFKSFKGAWRRFDEVGEYNGIKIINDYAHHPTAIKKTLAATHEKYPNAQICCVFQPHQYNRTKNFITEFGAAFEEAKHVLLPNIYQVRDTKEDIESVSIDDLVKSIENSGTKAISTSEYTDIKAYLDENKEEIDILLIMGAGDIWKLSEFLL